MTTHSLTLTPSEVRAALDDKLSLVVRPVSHKVMCLCGHPLSEHQEAAGHTVLGACGRFIPGAPCPLGVPGDRLCCKETWAHDAPSLAECRWRYEDIMGGLPGWGPYFLADPVHENAGLRWRSPATMPAWASRITLEVEGVRCCRLHDLSREDIRATGIHLPPCARFYATGEPTGSELHQEFADLWNRHYGKRYPWESSPWVWKAEVKRVAA